MKHIFVKMKKIKNSLLESLKKVELKKLMNVSIMKNIVYKIIIDFLIVAMVFFI